MGKLWGGFKVAFSMYSKIPMPKTEWTEENMRYAMCFFPMVGVVIGIATWLWTILCINYNLSWVLYSMGMVLIPILISGGIHLDGFCDTIDALSSHQSRERKLEILKDPHMGAFATMACCLYLMVMFSLYAEIGMRYEAPIFIGIGFVISRSLSGLSVVSFKSAKSDGTLATFGSMAEKRTVQITLLIYLGICFFLLLDFIYFIGIGIGIIVAAVLAFLYYKYISYKEFGGITGDLAGFFLQICELMITISICFMAKIY